MVGAFALIAVVALARSPVQTNAVTEVVANEFHDYHNTGGASNADDSADEMYAVITNENVPLVRSYPAHHARVSVPGENNAMTVSEVSVLAERASKVARSRQARNAGIPPGANSRHTEDAC
jgi:hypothetical protein